MRFGLGPATWFDGDYGKLWTWTTRMETNINQPTGPVMSSMFLMLSIVSTTLRLVQEREASQDLVS
jgi:hypothetical protein